MMKKILALTLALLMLVSLVACSKEEEQNEGGEIDLTVSNNESVFTLENGDELLFDYVGGDVVILGLRASHEPHAVTIPATINERKVAAIEAQAFYHLPNVTEVVLPVGIEKIGALAFADCTNLTKINLPNTLYEIGDAAFANCTSLKEITYVDPVATELGVERPAPTLGKMAFYNCKSLFKVTLPDRLVTISTQAFMNCESLIDVIWKAEGKSVADYAFFGCRRLTGFTFPVTAIELGDYAFANCAALTPPTWKGNEKVGENVFYVMPAEEAAPSAE